MITLPTLRSSRRDGDFSRREVVWLVWLSTPKSNSQRPPSLPGTVLFYTTFESYFRCLRSSLWTGTSSTGTPTETERETRRCTVAMDRPQSGRSAPRSLVWRVVTDVSSGDPWNNFTSKQKPVVWCTSRKLDLFVSVFEFTFTPVKLRKFYIKKKKIITINEEKTL